MSPEGNRGEEDVAGNMRMGSVAGVPLVNVVTAEEDIQQHMVEVQPGNRQWTYSKLGHNIKKQLKYTTKKSDGNNSGQASVIFGTCHQLL